MPHHPPSRHRAVAALAAVLAATAATASTSLALTVDPFYAGSYAAVTLGSVGNVPGPYGGLVFKDANTLLLGGNANNGSGAIYQAAVVRDADHHVISIGPATLFATAPNIDGGLAFGPGGVLFYTAYPTNQIGQIKPGSTAPDKVVAAPGVASSVGTLQFIPPGFDNAGGLAIASYNGHGFYTAGLTPDGNGTFDITGTTLRASGLSGPEGVIYVAAGNPLFADDSVLVSEYGSNRISAYTVDAFGAPVVGSRHDFITGLGGAEGAAVDPLTGDFLFSTFGSGNQVVRVSGFNAPPPAAAPTPAVASAAVPLLGLTALRRRRRNLA